MRPFWTFVSGCELLKVSKQLFKPFVLGHGTVYCSNSDDAGRLNSSGTGLFDPAHGGAVFGL